MKKIILILISICTSFLFLQCNCDSAQIYAFTKSSNISLKVGNYIQFGYYNSKPIVWRVIDINGNGVLIVSDKIISLKAFDASENGNADSKPTDLKISQTKYYGNSSWKSSNIREWLNSDDHIVNYSTQAPTKNAVKYHTNAYDKEAGFLTNFKPQQINLINSTAIITKAIKPSTYDTTNDKVFLLSAAEWNKYLKGDTATGLACPTKEAINNTIITDKNQEKPDSNQYWFYWLRDLQKDLYHTTYVYIDGIIHNSYPNSGICGIRPAMYLKSRNVSVQEGSTGKDYSPYDLNNVVYDTKKNTNTVTFKDSLVESAVRSTLNKPAGAIQKNDMELLNSITLNGEITSLDGLQYATNLSSLYIEYDNNYPLDLSPLSNLSRLNWLSLECKNYINNYLFDLKPLIKCNRLNILRLVNCKIDLGNFPDKPNLFDVELDKNHINDFSKLSKCKAISSLSIGQEDTSDLSTLSKIINLSTLAIYGKYNLSYLPKLNIKNLTISNLDESQGKYINNMHSLNSLSINGGSIANLNFLKNKEKFTLLFLCNLYNFTDFASIQNFKNISYLSIMSMPKVKNINFLKSLVHLNYLELISDGLTNIAVLKNMSNLKYLYLSSNEINDLTPLCSLGNLDILDITRNPVTKSQVEALKKALPLTDIQSSTISQTTVSPTTPDIKTTKISLKVDDYIQFGNYNGTPITWKVIDINTNGILVVSDKIICLKAFDASEGGNVTSKSSDINNSDINECGNSTWQKSNLREWLNSNDKIVNYSTYPPTEDAVAYHTNAYNNEAGFLSNFTNGENDFINQTIIRTKSVNPSGYINTNDKVFLLSSDEWAKYLKNDKDTRLAFPTKEAVDNTFIKDSNQEKPDPNQYWFYWLRDPYNDSAHISYVYTDDLVRRAHPNSGICGVRPAMYLKSRNVTVADSGSGEKGNPYKVIFNN